MRVFHDRLTASDDQAFVKRELHALLGKRFGSRESYEQTFSEEAPLLFASFTKLGVLVAERAYCKVKGACIDLSRSLVADDGIMLGLWALPRLCTTCSEC